MSEGLESGVRSIILTNSGKASERHTLHRFLMAPLYPVCYKLKNRVQAARASKLERNGWVASARRATDHSSLEP
jgi:hypothetical protein